jgi:PilZ domain
MSAELGGPSAGRKQEQRHYPRARVSVPIELLSKGASTPLRVKTADLNAGGLYLQMLFTLDIGTQVDIVLWLNGVKASAKGIVTTRDLQVGNGIEFTDMAPEDSEKLAHFLSQL